MGKPIGNKTIFLSGNIVSVALFLLTGILVISVLFQPFNYAWGKGKVIVCTEVDSMNKLSETREGLFYVNDSVVIDTVSINMSFLKEMRSNGQLLSSDEFASRITNYYNALIAVLAIMFGVIAFVQWVTINRNFEKRFDDKRAEIDEKLKSDIETKLGEMLNDSIEMREVIVESISKNVVEQLATHEDFDNVSNDVNAVDIKLNNLIKEIEDIREQISTRAEITKKVEKKADDTQEDGNIKKSLTSVQAEESEMKQKGGDDNGD